MNNVYQRTEQILGKENLEILQKANLCIIGIGGVGSYTIEALARTGIGNITIIDKDIIDATNINRQLIATKNNIGNIKVEEAKIRIQQINPNVNVNSICDKINEDNITKYITEEYDYIIDAIDDVSGKIAIIKRCKEINIPVISCMGTANKLDPMKLKIADISKTEMCPLAKVVRKKLKEQGITKVKVVFSTEQPKKDKDVLGSLAYVTGTAGLIIAAEVVKDLMISE